MQNPNLQSYQPTKYSSQKVVGVMSVMSILFLLTVGTLLQLYGEFYYRNLLREDLGTELSGAANAEKIDSLLGSLIQSRKQGYGLKLSDFLSPGSTVEARMREDEIARIGRVLVSINSNLHQKGLREFEIFLRDDSAQKKEGGLRSGIERNFSSIIEIKNEIKALESRLERNNSKLKTLIERMTLVADELADNFRISEARININSEKIVYEYGLLEGLPILENIPDRITDPADLKKHFDVAGGQISGDSGNANLQFTSTVDNIRQLSSEIHVEWKALKQYENLNLNTISLNQENLINLNSKLKRLVQALASELLSKYSRTTDESVLALITTFNESTSAIINGIIGTYKDMLNIE